MTDQQSSATVEGPNRKSGTVVDGQTLKTLVEAGLTWLKTNQQTVNALNVFPVPDGDTGTNMVQTMQAACNEVVNSGERNAGKMAKSIAQGALMGARGNSGVILSQLWRGFARALDNFDVFDGKLLADALNEARNTAYKGVVRPVEGTILTVATDIALAAQQAAEDTNDPAAILEQVVAAADESVKHTPELLPILKQAGVVDSGGKGLFFILEGILRYINQQPIDTALLTVQPISAMNLENTMETIEPGQDYEVVVDFRPNQPLDLENFYSDLEKIGSSIQVGEGDGMYRMHIHVPTDKRYEPIEYTMGIGVVTKVAIENLIAQMQNGEHSTGEAKLPITPIEPGQIAVVAVSPGAGISRIFASLGVAAIVNGGHTMNPSTNEIVKAFENLPTDKIIILPNNKNIVLAAKAAADVTVKKIAVIPSTSVPQGFSAMLRHNPTGDFDQIVNEMNTALGDIETGEITVATRSVEINGVDVEKGQVIALLNGKLVASANNLEDACKALLGKVDISVRERITMFYGDNISKQEVNRIADHLRQAFPDQEIEIHDGGQPHYQFIISIE
jgi:DAK2 domain fusion protein YloV